MFNKSTKNIDYKSLMHDITLIAGSEILIDEFLQKTFSTIGNTLRVSRVYYFGYNKENHEISNLYEWVKGSVSEQKNNLQAISCYEVDWFYQKLNTKTIFNCPNINEIPDSKVVDILTKQDIKSLLAVPVYVHNQFEGFVGFDQCDYRRKWNDFDELILCTLAIMCSQSIKDKKLEDALKNEHRQLLAMVDNLGGLSYACELDTYKIIYANNELKSLYDDELEGKICYQVLQGKDMPCDFCTNKYIINTNEAYSWDYYNPTLRKDFHLIDRLVTFPNGKKVRFEVGFDITKQKEYTRNLNNEKELFKVTLLSIGDSVITTDKSGRITMLNKAAEELLGYTFKQAMGKPLSSIYNPVTRDQQQKKNIIEIALESKNTVTTDGYNLYKAKNGEEIYVSESASPIKDSENQVIGAVLVIRNETEKVKRDEKINYLSTRDSLTGLYNRGYFEQLINRLDTKENLPISIIIGDVNGLKLTNDVFGHDRGDVLLKSIAQIMQKSCSDKGFVSRFGGDEFVVILPNTLPKQANEIIRKIKNNCNNPEQGVWPYSISLGYATKQLLDEEIIVTLKHAEDFMYKNKLTEGRKLRSEVINTMQHNLYQKTYETAEHAERIMDTSIKIARHLGLPENLIEQIKILAKYHDIGKVSISKDILLKKNKLTKDDWNKLKRHPEIGYRIVKALPELSHVAEFVLCLRERWDGKGYPQGLTGKEIPLLSRIVAVADAFDAMTNSRPYRQAMTKDKAIKEIRNSLGKQFDPELVWILLNKVL